MQAGRRIGGIIRQGRIEIKHPKVSVATVLMLYEIIILSHSQNIIKWEVLLYNWWLEAAAPSCCKQNSEELGR
jgi:hypothetical protein